MQKIIGQYTPPFFFNEEALEIQDATGKEVERLDNEPGIADLINNAAGKAIAEALTQYWEAHK